MLARPETLHGCDAVQGAVAGPEVVGGAFDLVVPPCDAQTAAEDEDSYDEQQDEKAQTDENDDHLVGGQTPQHRSWIHICARLSGRTDGCTSRCELRSCP